MILTWIFIGVVVGVVGFFIDHRRAKGGLPGAVLFGIAGSVIGGIVANVLLNTSFFNLSTFLIVLSASIFLLLVQRTVFSEGPRY